MDTCRLHKGHRERLRKKFKMKAMEEHEHLELLLTYCIRQKNTNETAHRLLARFGSIYDVLNADEEMLTKVEGVGESTALFLKVIAETVARYRQGKVKMTALLSDRNELELYLTSLFIGSKTERVFVLLFGANGRMLESRCVEEGFASSARIPVGKIMQMATATGACTVILAHNHPEGLAVPSQTDVESTRRLAVSLAQIGVTLRDHMVVAGDECYSVFNYMKEQMNGEIAEA